MGQYAPRRTMMIDNPLGPFEPTWESLENYVTPDWYLDAKFGIFIHWGVYSVPAFKNEWYARNMYIQGTEEFDHHIKTYGSHEDFGYKDFIPMFKAGEFDADEWVDIFVEAGAKFIVPVAEHHDGFAMYPTKINKWNAFVMGPQRDVVGELAAATRKRDLVFGVSSHRIEHWWFMNGGRQFPSDIQDPEFADLYGPATPGGFEKGTNPMDESFMDDWLMRCAELVDNYRPQLFWFDWWIEQPELEPYRQRFASYYYNRAHEWDRGVAINYKNEAFPEKAAVLDIERGHLSNTRSMFWQTDTAVAKNSWSYVHGMDYKTPQRLIHDLIDIVSKNGALLLNIGPKSDGTIPQEDQDILREIGAWLKVNGEAIYGTRPWKVFGEGPTEVLEGHFNDVKRDSFGPEDIRFTQKDGVLYAMVLEEGIQSIKINSLGSTAGLEMRNISKIEVLGGGICEFDRQPDRLLISLENGVQRHAVTLRISFQNLTH